MAGIPNHVPVGRVAPHHVKLLLRQWALQDVPSLAQVSAFVMNVFAPIFVDFMNYIPYRSAALSRVKDTSCIEPEDEVFGEIAGAVTPEFRVPP